jgi:hypothetical protein
LYFEIFSASSLTTFLSPEIAASITIRFFFHSNTTTTTTNNNNN